MNIVHANAVQAPQLATTPAPAAPVSEPGFHDALAAAQNAGSGSETGAANHAASAGGTDAAKAADAGKALPGKKEKGSAADGAMSDQTGVQPVVLAAAFTVSPVVASLPALPSIADPSASLQQSTDGKAEANTTEILTQNLPVTPGEGSAPAALPGAPSGAALGTEGASLPSLPVPLAAQAMPASSLLPSSSLLPATDASRHSPSALAGASAVPHSVSEPSTVAAPARLDEVHAPKDLSSTTGPGAPPAQTFGAHLLPGHHGEVSGKAAAPGNSLASAKPATGASASSQSRGADSSGTQSGSHSSSSEPSGSNAGSSNGGSTGGTATPSGMQSGAASPPQAFVVAQEAAPGATATLLGPSPAQAVTAGGSESLTPLAPLAPAEAARSSTPMPGTLPGSEATATINTAQVLGRMNGTEMRVGMRSEEFGSISIQTSVSPGNVVAQIALDHSALGRALAVHLPAMEEKLGTALGVTARVELRDTALQSSMQGSNSGAAGNGASANGGAGGGGHSASSGSFSQRAFDMDSGPRFAGGEVNGSPGERLSIHA